MIKKIVGLVLVLTVISVNTEDIQSQGLKTLIRVYDDCQKAEFGLQICLKKKAIKFLRRIGQVESINLSDGLKFIRSDDKQQGSAIPDNELEQSLPRTLEARDHVLNNILSDQVARFLSNSTIQLEVPKITPDEIGRAMEEGD